MGNRYRTVINVHDGGATLGSQAFTYIIRSYPVIALFAGHIHGGLGEKGPIATTIPSAHWFQCGSSTYNTFLAVTFAPTTMEVFSIEGETGHPVIMDYKTYPL